MSTRGAFYKNTAWQFILQVVKYLFPLLTLPYLTRVLAPEGYAVYAYTASTMMLLSVLVEFGFNFSGTKLIAKSHSNTESNRIVGAITIARLFLCVAVALIVLLLCSFVPILNQNIIFVAVAYAATCMKALSPDFVFQGFEKMGPITTRYFISLSVLTVAIFVMIRSADDLIWIPIFELIASTIALVWSFSAAKRLFGVSIAITKLRYCVKLLRISWPYFFTNISAGALTGLSTLLVGIMIVDPAQISFWSLSIMAITAVQSLYAPVTNSLYPHMVRNSDFRFARKVILIFLPIAAVGTVVFALLAPVIMRVLGGVEYVPGAEVLLWLSPMLFTSFFSILLGWPVLGAVGNVRQLALSAFITTVFNTLALCAIAVLGIASIAMIAVVRNVSELLLAALRAYFSRNVLFPAKASEE